MNLRVLHVASGREWRGGQRQVWLLARGLAALGIPQAVITGTGSVLATRLKEVGIPVHDVGWTLGLDPRAAMAAIIAARREPVVLHAHDAHSAVLASFARRWTRRPFVATRRTNFPLSRPGAWARADRVIAISSAVRATLERSGIPPSRLVVIPSGIDVAETRLAEPLGIRETLGISAAAPLLVTVGALTVEKGHEHLISALALLRESMPEIHLVMAGSGPLRSQLERQANEAGVSGQVHLLGNLPEAARLIAEADLFVLPSREEGLGTSVLEAFALRKPVLASAVGGVPDLVGTDAGVLVPPADPAALAGAIRRILGDPALRDQCVAAAEQHLAAFTSSGMADRHRTVYRSLVSVH
jgi:glycosyltransferase involved in cell wall biosynthesis